MLSGVRDAALESPDGLVRPSSGRPDHPRSPGLGACYLSANAVHLALRPGATVDLSGKHL